MRALKPRNIVRNARKVVRDVRHRGLGQPWMEVEPRDRFLASFPRSGNTWLRHILYFYLQDNETVDMTELDEFCPIIDGIDLKAKLARKGDAAQRFIKTHELGADYFLAGKIVFLVRDGRDATLSWHKYRMGFGQANGDFDAFLRACLDDKFRYKAWHTNVASWLPLVDSPRTLLLKFEDLKADTAGVFAQVLAHMDVPVDQDRIARAVALASPNKVAQTFKSEVRARHTVGDGAGQGGQSDRWRASYTPEQLKLFDDKAGEVLTALGYPLGAS